MFLLKRESIFTLTANSDHHLVFSSPLNFTSAHCVGIEWSNLTISLAFSQTKKLFLSPEGSAIDWALVWVVSHLAWLVLEDGRRLTLQNCITLTPISGKLCHHLITSRNDQEVVFYHLYRPLASVDIWANKRILEFKP